MKLYTPVLLVSFLCLVRTVTALDCSNKTLSFCLDYLSRDGLDIDHIDDDLPTWNATVSGLQDRCRTFDKFTECMSGVTESCSSRKYEGWIDAYEYLCKKSNLTLVVDYLECYTSPPVVRAADSLCKQIFDFKSKELLNGSSTVPRDKMADYCKLADSFFNCLNKTLTTNCGEDAAKWQWTWDRTLSMPILQTCPGWTTIGVDDDSGTSAWTIALIIVLILVTGFMILALVFLLIFILKKRKQRTRSQQVRRQTQSSLPPPPYSAVIFTSSEPGAEPQTHLVDSGVVLSPEEREGSDAPTASGDVVLPPPYMGDRPPVPAYDAILPTNPRQEEKKEGTDGFDGQPEINADEMDSSDKPSDE